MQDWQARVLMMNTYELRAIARGPASAWPRGYKAFALRELRRRENNHRCEQCGRKVDATIFGKCGACLRFAPQPGQCCQDCGVWHPEERLIAGSCPDCHAARITAQFEGQTLLPVGYVRAGEDLPPQEVFSKAELERLEFAKWLVAAGKLEG